MRLKKEAIYHRESARFNKRMYFAFGFLDLPPLNAFQPGPEDPIGESEAFIVDGEPARVDLPLAIP